MVVLQLCGQLPFQGRRPARRLDQRRVGDCGPGSAPRLYREKKMTSPHPRFSFKVVTPPFLNHPIDVPPVLNASDHTVDFGALLMYGEHDQVHTT